MKTWGLELIHWITVWLSNTIVKGVYCTVYWHVDNFKVFHLDEAVVTNFAPKLVNLYEGRIKIHPSMVLDYLKMDLSYGSSPGALSVSRIWYLTKVLEERPKELRGSKEIHKRTKTYYLRR